jgi:hypothetical protein
MRREVFLIPIIVCAVTLGACQMASRANQSDVSPSSTPNANNRISFKGVSFTFDSSLAREVKSDTLPQVTDGKPCDIVPEHPAFTLVGFPRPRAQGSDPQIRVLPLREFRQAVDIASEENKKSVVYPTNPPSWTTYFDEEVRVLRALLEKHPTSEELKPFLAKVRSPEERQFNNFPQMPFLPMWEASQAFYARPQYVRFKNSRGVFFLTQWNVSDTSQVTNEGLEYAFQGLTDDGQYLIYAEFSVHADFLPSDDDPKVAAWNEKHYRLPQKSKEYQAYLKPIVAKLEAMPSDEFQPSLILLEQLIRSMEVSPK